MSPETKTAGKPNEEFYEETVVEYEENRRQRFVLAAILVLVFLLFAGVTTAVVVLTRGTGAPTAAELPKGVTWVRSIYGWGTAQNQMLQNPSDAAFAPDGSIWTISAARYIIGFNADGSLRKLIAPPRGKALKQVHTLEGIYISPSGKIYVTDEGKNKVIEFDQNGNWVGEWGILYPIEITGAGDGKLAVTGSGGVAVVTTQPKLIAKWGNRGKTTTSFDLPHGIAVGKNGTVFVADTQNARVSAFTPQGKRLWSTGRTQGASGTVEGAFQLPSGMAIDGAGNVQVVDAFKFSIFTLNPSNGKIIAKYGEYGEQDGFFGYPTGLDYDAARDWFVVADTANNRLQVLQLPNTGGTAGSAVARALIRPVWVFCLPLLLLLLAVIMMVVRRRAKRGEDRGSGETPAAPQAG
jgi:sugar lactone lactonase YvrE